MTYINNGKEGAALIEAIDRAEAVRKFRKQLGIANISQLDYFHDRDVTDSMDIYTANRETGTFIEKCESIEEALNKISDYEKEDKANGTYEPDFYNVVDENHITIY